VERVVLDPARWMDRPVLAKQTCAQMAGEGILIAALDEAGKLNPMTIGWGLFGWIWGRPVFTVLVRPSRYTYGCIERTGDFTVNVPPVGRRDLVEFCGSVSGRHHDKMAVQNLSPLPSRHVTSPGIAECPLVFECKVIHKNDVVPDELGEDIPAHFYVAGDYHRIYFGQIMAVSLDDPYWRAHES